MFQWVDNIVGFGIVMGLVFGRMMKLFGVDQSNMLWETKTNL